MKIDFSGHLRTSFIFMMILIVTSCSFNRKKKESPKADQQPSEISFRPFFHFTPEKYWINDPNGMVYYHNTYHLFFQYSPGTMVSGEKSWGHAISSDLMHWKELPVALDPDSLGSIYSGSAILDSQNTSGFGTIANPPLVAVFTYHNSKLKPYPESQALAYSTDDGLNWEKYSGNPVIKNPGIQNFRDPNVFWYDKTGRWIMILAAGDRVRLYSSANLLDWTFESEFGANAGAHGGVWECPDLFKLTTEDGKTGKWVMLVNINPGGPNGGSATQYFTGEFDGHRFQADTQDTKWADFGPDDYAGVTWSNTGQRKILIGWMSNWAYSDKVPTDPFRGSMTLPRDLSLESDQEGYILKSFPSPEFDRLLSGLKTINSETIGRKENLYRLPAEAASSFVLDLSLDLSSCDTFNIRFSNGNNESVLMRLSNPAKMMTLDRSASGITDFSPSFNGISRAPLLHEMKQTDLYIVVDRCSVEIFMNHGERVITSLCFPEEPFNTITLSANGGNASLKRMQIQKVAKI